jgi:hypothetical protein
MCTLSFAPNHAFSLSVPSNQKLVLVVLLLLPMIQYAISKETGSRTIYIALSSVSRNMTTDVLSTLYFVHISWSINNSTHDFSFTDI